MLNIAEIEFRQACERLGVQREQLGHWDIRGDETFVGADGRRVKNKDDVVLTRPVPVTSGARWQGGDAQPGCIATVLKFSTGAPGVAQLECYCDPDGFAFGWEEIAYLKLYKTTEEKWPK